jgi:hypothetical protein
VLRLCLASVGVSTSSSRRRGGGNIDGEAVHASGSGLSCEYGLEVGSTSGERLPSCSGADIPPASAAPCAC